MPTPFDPSPNDGRPASVEWTYTRAEQVADGIVHVIGVMFAMGAAISLIVICLRYANGVRTGSALVYAGTLLATLVVSGAYNMWPVSRTKWILRRFDHAMIYTLIAGTYTPFLILVDDPLVHVGLLAAVWAVALTGVILKLTLPGILDRAAIALYLGLGWSGVLVVNDVIAVLPNAALWLIGIGGVLYSTGVIFHVWRRLRFQNAIWHCFVLAAAVCQYAAVVVSLVYDRA